MTSVQAGGKHWSLGQSWSNLRVPPPLFPNGQPRALSTSRHPVEIRRNRKATHKGAGCWETGDGSGKPALGKPCEVQGETHVPFREGGGREACWRLRQFTDPQILSTCEQWAFLAPQGEEKSIHLHGAPRSEPTKVQTILRSTASGAVIKDLTVPPRSTEKIVTIVRITNVSALLTFMSLF